MKEFKLMEKITCLTCQKLLINCGCLEEEKMRERCIDCEYKFNTKEMTSTDEGDWICEECKANYCDCGASKSQDEEVCRECL